LSSVDLPLPDGPRIATASPGGARSATPPAVVTNGGPSSYRGSRRRSSITALRLSFFACVIAGYSAAVYSPYRVPALASLPVAAFLHVTLQDGRQLGGGRRRAVPDPAADRRRGRRPAPVETPRRRGAARMSAMEHEQAEALRRATEHERARIARELHDVVTHNVSVMVIQAGAARKVMDTGPDQAREALLAVEAGGRAAMTELRHVMGLLTMQGRAGPGRRRGPGTAAGPRPARRAGRADARHRRAGRADRGAAAPLPSGVELAAYRVVQEALTNVVKHAAGASRAVLVDYGDDHLRVEVADTGGRPAAAGTGTGRGLIGLRERLAVYGGPCGGARPTAATASTPGSRWRHVTEPLRVVVADDQALVRAGFRMILTADGIDVVAEATNGAEAVDAVRRTRPDVVLMDIRMPEMDGLEATRRILSGAGDRRRGSSC
jgi:signal transduction histidine kinase